MNNSDKYPEIFEGIAAHAAEQLVETGLVDKERAADIGLSIAEFVRKNWSGMYVYLPKGITFDLDKKYHEIFQKFNGFNVPELAREYDLSEIRIYQIVKRVRTEEIRRRQRDLFATKAEPDPA